MQQESQLFTLERDARRERHIDQTVFDLLSSTEEWCALYAPVGEPRLKRVPKTPFGHTPQFEEILAYDDQLRLIAVNHPEPRYGADWAIAEVYDHQRGRTYYINNLQRTMTPRNGIHETIHTGKCNIRLIFKGTVEGIIQEFQSHGYRMLEENGLN